jgi:hypothetical protein
VAGEQAGQRPAHPAGVHPGQVDLGDQRLGAMAEPLVSRQQRALPFALARRIAQPGPRHRQLQRTEGRHQPAGPTAVAVPLAGAITLVATTAESGFELLLEQLLDQAAHLQAHRFLQRIEPGVVRERRWRRIRG